ncbi:MAG: NYN domain-containing protein [Candidatus Kapabacteria bacterium]|nr:NYN domain-containing protein [Candidatus Kapabacteria bacterium]
MRKRIDRPVERLLIAHSTLYLPDAVSQIPPGLHTVVQSNGVEKVLSVYDHSYPKEINPSYPVYARVFTREEKGSDVNLAVTMLNDAWRDEYDTALVLSNDSDLREPVRMVCNELGKKVVIGFVPQDSNRVNVSERLKDVASGVFHVRWSMLRRNQLPETVSTSNGSVVTKPVGW